MFTVCLSHSIFIFLVRVPFLCSLSCYSRKSKGNVLSIGNAAIKFLLIVSIVQLVAKLPVITHTKVFSGVLFIVILIVIFDPPSTNHILYFNKEAILQCY